MASRDLADLHYLLRDPAYGWIATWERRHPEIQLLVTCTLRDAEEQARLYRRNRTRGQIEWAVRRLRSRDLGHLADVLANAPPQPGPPPRRYVTKAMPGTSFHQPHTVAGQTGALALDFVPLVDGKAAWDRADLIEEAGEIAEELGLTWSGRWGWESVHVQYDDGGAFDPWDLARGVYA